MLWPNPHAVPRIDRSDPPNRQARGRKRGLKPFRAVGWKTEDQSSRCLWIIKEINELGGNSFVYSDAGVAVIVAVSAESARHVSGRGQRAGARKQRNVVSRYRQQDSAALRNFEGVAEQTEA